MDLPTDLKLHVLRLVGLALSAACLLVSCRGNP